MLNFSTAKIPPPVTPKAPRVRVRKPPSPEPKVPIVLRQDPTPWGPERVDVPIVVGSFEQRFVLSMIGLVFPWNWLKLLPIQLVHYDWFIDLPSIVGAARFLNALVNLVSIDPVFTKPLTILFHLEKVHVTSIWSIAFCIYLKNSDYFNFAQCMKIYNWSTDIWYLLNNISFAYLYQFHLF